MTGSAEAPRAEPPAALRLGLALGGQRDAADWQRDLALAARAEGLGFGSAWLPEGHFQPGATSAPLVGLAALAGRTRRMRLATTSLLLPLHHPLRVAADVAALDLLSGGRVVLGLGRGFRPPAFQGFGVAAQHKRDRFDESLDALLEAWSGRPFRLEGSHWSSLDARPLRLGVRPLQRPHPPLVVAAFGPKGLRQAARRGLAYLASPLESLPVLEENQRLWREGLEAEGRSPPKAGEVGAVPVMRTVHVSHDAAETHRVREALRRAAPRAPRNAPAALRRAAAGRLEDRVLVGGANEVADGLARYRERLGMDLLVVRPALPGARPAEVEASLERLAMLVAAAPCDAVETR